jgi:16S rRNA (uracil1498-N3)-methyltransferase
MQTLNAKEDSRKAVFFQAMSERFYMNCPLQPGPIDIEGPEAHHLAIVCRVRPGDAVCLFNGDGREYPARVTAVQRRTVAVEVLEATAPERELPFSLAVACPLPKGDRAQFLLEKLTEIGVTSFVPLSTERSVVHPRETRMEKLQRYIVEASKQCGRNVLMRLEPVAHWEDYCCRGDLPKRKLLAHPGGRPLRDLQRASETGVVIAVGPEGGFSDAEVAASQTAGWTSVSLGPRILRVETAALVLAARIAANEDH